MGTVATLIKYLGSKRRLVPVLAGLAQVTGARRALDLFTGTTRVAQAWRRDGISVVAADLGRAAHVFARAYVATALDGGQRRVLEDELGRLDALAGDGGYVTEVFCCQARYFTPANGERIDAIRAAIAADHAGTWLEPLVLTALIEAADRVDSTTGLQMAYLKRWAPRALGPLRLRAPAIPEGPRGWAVRGDARTVARAVGPVDLAYLDPPYNQHRYDANYHVWETLVAWDEPNHYGVACKRTDLKEATGRSVFNDRRRMPAALAACITGADARVVAVSCNDEGWVGVEEVVELCREHGPVEVLSFGSRRYVGAQIGIHNRDGVKVGTAGRSHNVEHVVVAGDLTQGERDAVRALGAAAAVAETGSGEVYVDANAVSPQTAEPVAELLDGRTPPAGS